MEALWETTCLKSTPLQGALINGTNWVGRYRSKEEATKLHA